MIALAAGKRRIDGHAVADLQSLDRGAGFQHRTRTLVSKGRRILQDLVADPSFQVVMHVGTANPDAVDLQEHVARPLPHGLGDVDQLDAAEGGKTGAFHGLGPANQ